MNINFYIFMFCLVVIFATGALLGFAIAADRYKKDPWDIEP